MDRNRRTSLAAILAFGGTLICADATDAILRAPKPDLPSETMLIQLAPENDAAWQTVKDRCTDLRHYNASRQQLRVSQQEFVSYLQQVERANPGKSRQQITAALHAAHYPTDLNRTLPGTSIPLFLQGRETAGWEDVNLLCSVKVGGKQQPFVPKFVYSDAGEEIDIGHALVGVRSDLNRPNKDKVWARLMGQLNTNLGDYWQVYTDSWRKFPMNQLRGNLLGNRVSALFRSDNPPASLSEGFATMFRSDNLLRYPEDKGELIKTLVEDAKVEAVEAGMPILDELFEAVAKDAEKHPDPAKKPVPPPENDIALQREINAEIASLDGALAEYENTVKQEQERCALIARAILPEGPDSIPVRIAQFKDNVDRLLEKLRPNVGDEQIALTKATEMADALEPIADRMVEDADALCTSAGSDSPNLEASKTALTRLRALGVLADRMTIEAKEDAQRLATGIAKDRERVDTAELNKQLQSIGHEHINYCRAVGAGPKLGSVAAAGPLYGIVNLSEKIASAEGSRLTPDAASGYRQTIATRRQWMLAINALGGSDAKACQANADKARQLCVGLDDLTRRLGEAATLSTGVPEELDSRRNALAETVETLRNRISALGDRQAAAVAAAVQCHGIVEAKSSAPDPKVLGEAEQISDPMNAACEAADLRSRAAQLRQAKFADLPGVTEKSAELERLAGILDGADAAYDRAKDAYFKGDTETVNAELDAVETGLGRLGPKPNCQAMHDKVAEARDKAARLAEALERGEETLRRCDPDKLRGHHRALLSSSGHPALAELKSRMARQLAAIDRYTAFYAALKNNELDQARRSLNEAKEYIAKAPKQDCVGLRRKIESGADTIAAISNAQDKADALIRSCDTDGIRRFNYSLPGDDDGVVSRNLRIRLDAALETCSAKNAERDKVSRNARCEAEHGRGYYAGEPDSAGTYYCLPSKSAADAWCNANNAGSGWTAGPIGSTGGFNCNKSAKQQQAENNATCREKFGAGYYAGKLDGKGQFYCLPTKQTANAKCREANGGGAVAGRIRNNGSFDCQWTKNARTQQAWAACRRQYGNRLVDVRIYKNGSYNCIFNRGTVAQQPRHDTRSSAAAAAAAGALIQGVIGAINRDRGGSGGRVPTYRPPPPAAVKPAPGHGPNDHCKNMSIAAPTCT